MKLTYRGDLKPEIGDNLSFLFNQWDDKQVYLLNKDGKIWLSFETSQDEKLALLRLLAKRWIELG